MPESERNFAATRWTLVLRAQGEGSAARAALSDLCAAYYGPVVAFLQRRCGAEDSAREQAHAFFAQVLAGRSLAGADPARGRFRSYLLGALRHFLADAHDRASAAKRGGGAEPVPLDTMPECNIAVVASDVTAFDRQWAMTVIGRAMDAISGEWSDGGKAAQFEVLKQSLPGAGDAVPMADLARRLDITEGAAKVAVHRLRARFRELVKAEIAQTVPDEADVEDELRHLIAVLSRAENPAS